VKSSLASAAVVVLALAAAGCGGGSAPPSSAQGAAQQLLRQSDLARYPAGSPARAILEWWRSAQFADAEGYRAAFAPPLRSAVAKDPRAADALNYFAGAIRDARPKILSVSAAKGRATVYTLIEYRQPIGTTRYITSTVPRAFTLERIASRWLLTDDAFVQTTLPAVLRRR
jgi:hypothetical protein